MKRVKTLRNQRFGRRRMYAAFLAACSPFCYSAQGQTQAPQSSPGIVGHVIEPGLNLPVGGATVRAWRMPPPGALVTGRTFSVAAAVKTVETDSNGAFSIGGIEGGKYRVEASKEGYGPASPPLQATLSSLVVESGEKGTDDVKLAIARPGHVEGELIDGPTGSPAPDARLMVWSTHYFRGERRIVPAGMVSTDDAGRFRSADLAPGEYVISLRPAPPAERLRTGSEARYTKPSGAGADGVFWPGGGSLADALPIVVVAHSTVSVGAIRLQSNDRFQASFRGISECSPPESVAVFVAKEGGWMEELGKVLCGETFVIGGFAPGHHRVEFYTPGRLLATRLRGSALLDFVDHNIDDVVVPLLRGFDLQGEIIAVGPNSGTAPALDSVAVEFRAVGGIIQADETPVRADSDGRFRIVNASAVDHTVNVSGVPEGYFVSEILVDGVVAEGGVIPASTFRNGSALRIILGDRPSRVLVSVKEFDRNIPDAVVIMAPWPLVKAGSEIRGLRTVHAGRDRLIDVGGLAPGEYRVASVRPEEEGRLDSPLLIDELLERGIALTLEKGREIRVEVRATTTR
jgi:hypothetical protein